MANLSRDAAAFSLIEVVLALGIVVFALTIIQGVFSIGLTTSHESAEEMQAAHLAQSIINTRRSTPDAELGSRCPLPVMGTNAANTAAETWVDGNGRLTTMVEKAQYRLKYQITVPPNDESPVTLYMCFSWPPQAPKGKASGRYEIVSQFPH